MSAPWEKYQSDSGPWSKYQEPETDWPKVVGQSVKDMFQKPAAFAKNLGTNPETMANAMPTLGGLGGAVMMPWGGSTVGTGAGQAVRDVALKTLGKPVPGLLQHGAELGTAVLGDVAPVPFMKKSYFGGQIGKAEQAQGIVARGATKAVTPGTVGETLNNLESQLDAGLLNNPQSIKDAKEIIDQVYANPRIYEKSPGINVQAARLASKVQRAMNGPKVGPALIPGRGEPSQAMAQAMTIPRNINKAYQAIPSSVRKGIGYGTGVGAAGGASFELIKRLLGG